MWRAGWDTSRRCGRPGLAVYPAPSLDTTDLSLQAGPFVEIIGIPGR